MKKSILIFTLMLFATIAFAQIDGTVTTAEVRDTVKQAKELVAKEK
jgi:hypothetical protein